MTVGGYGQMRATDADRESVHGVLQAAYADGRLTWDEFESRSSSLMQAKTYDELGALTYDLRQPVPYRPAAYPPAVRGTNALAVVSLCFGIGQFFLWFVGGIVAIVCGHIARRQIRETGESGDGLAVAGLIMGYLGVAVPLLAILALIAGIASHG
jgi:hypothetical protein